MKQSVLRHVSTLSLALALFCVHRDVLAANYPLEITQPQAGLTTRSRFYKAYPGLEYRVRPAVIGGAYPFQYRLTTAPAGMIIDAFSGEIIWPAPAASGTPYPVTLQVTDNEGTVVTRSWTITVTTSGFYFLDAVNGRSVANGGTGSIGNPWRSIRDMYEGSDYAAKSKNTYSGAFLYFKSGTYVPDGYLEDACPRLPLSGGDKPIVWMAYPGSTPILDLSTAYIQIYNGGHNTYISGFNITNITNCLRYGFRLDSDANNVTFWKNTFHGLTPLSGTNNQSAIMISRAATPGNYWSFQNNEFYEIRHGYGILGYLTNKVLVENNTFHDFSDPLGEGMVHAIGPKQSTTMWFIRGNRLWNVDGYSIWVHYNDNYGICRDIEVSFNLAQNIGSDSHTLWVGQSDNPGGPVYVFRNTFVGGPCQFSNVDGTVGPYYVYQNVIVNQDNVPDHITCSNCADPSRLVRTNNLSGFGSDNIVDAAGNLTTNYLQFVGSRGHQLSLTSDGVPPRAISDLRPR